MKRLVVIAVAALCVVYVAAASASSNGWHLGYYNSSGQALSNSSAAPGNGIASFGFTSEPNTALLINTAGGGPGDITGETITATFTISDATGAFTYEGEGTVDNPCGTPANTRLFFETSNKGGFDFTHYWWSNPASATLANGTLTVTATVEPAEWSDWNGQNGATQPDGFAAAAANVTGIGLSFGGGCFFENGVGTTDGSGTFTLDSFTTS